ncbi:MAG: sarcosine oxidase subunit gamma family protein [Rhodospirillaceae bacterium]
MADAYLRQSPLAHLHLDARALADEGLADAGVELAEVRHRDMLNLRGDADDLAFTAAVKSVIDIEPPKAPNTVATGNDEIHIIGLGPDEWLVVTAPTMGDGVATRLRAALAGQFATVVPVGYGRTTIRVSGPNARDVLAKGTSIDLYPAAFGPGRAAETMIARSSALIRCVAAGRGKPPCFEIVVAASFAEYVWTWLEDASREYGARVGV